MSAPFPPPLASWAPDAPVSTSLFDSIITQLIQVSNGVTSTPYIGGAPWLNNGSFELDPPGSPSIQYWTFSNNSNMTGQIAGPPGFTNAVHGRNSFVFYADTDSGGCNGVLAYGTTVTPSSPSDTDLYVSDNEAYVLGLDYLTTSSGNLGNGSVTAYWFAPTVATSFGPQNVVFANQYAQAGVWNNVQILLVPPHGATSVALVFQVEFGSGQGPQHFYLDNVHLKLRESNTTYAFSNYPGGVTNYANVFWSIPLGTQFNTDWPIPAGVHSIEVYGYAANKEACVAKFTSRIGNPNLVSNYGGAFYAQLPCIPGTTINLEVNTNGNVFYAYSIPGAFQYGSSAVPAYDSSQTSTTGGQATGYGMLSPQSSTYQTGTILVKY